MSPEIVADAKPPRPLVTSHSRRASGVGLSSRLTRITSTIALPPVFPIVPVAFCRDQNERAFRGDPKIAAPVKRRCADSAILRRFARPQDAPAVPLDWCQQRLGRRGPC